MQEVEAALLAAGKFDAVNFTSQGVAGIFALYASGDLRWVFLNEFVNVRAPRCTPLIRVLKPQ
jgi:hypothetical protein